MPRPGRGPAAASGLAATGVPWANAAENPGGAVDHDGLPLYDDGKRRVGGSKLLRDVGDFQKRRYDR